MHRRTCMPSMLATTLIVAATIAPAGLAAAPESATEDVSPARRIDPDRNRGRGNRGRPPLEGMYRTLDGTGNNVAAPEMGAAFTNLVRLLPSDYADGLTALAGPTRPSARVVSNIVIDQDASIPNPFRTSDFLWQWGQFLDHDLDLTDGIDPPEPEPIVVPGEDAFFFPGPTMEFNRSLYDPSTGIATPREQVNEITSWIDASNVYGSEHERAEALRTLDGTGRLKTSAGGLLPFNEAGLPNAGGEDPTLFLAGDVRANEQVGLAVMHTLFVREHNRLADELAERHPDWSGEEIYQKARRIVGAQMQVITYREFLPALLGPRGLSRYEGYDPAVEAGVTNVFSAAAYRLGHSALSPTLLRLDADGAEIPAGHLALRDAFFATDAILEAGIEPVLRGLAAQRHQRIDARVIDDVRNFLFGAPPTAGFDLAALNIQRGRDHGLPSYNDARRALGLVPAVDFTDVSSDPENQARLASAYGTVEEIDLWVGGLAEDAVGGGQLGELFTEIVARQFEALRDGDRFWYTRTLTPSERAEVERTRLSDIIRRNTSIGRELHPDVFHVHGGGGEEGGGG